MTTARIAPVEPPYSEPVAAALERVMPAGVPPLLLFRTLAVNERVLLGLLAGRFLERGSISLRDREIVIDRTCARCGSEYEWGVHVAFFGERVGLTAEQLAATCASEPTASAFPPRERLLLRLVDELHDTAQVGDRLWNELRAEWTDEQLIELVVLVGRYHLVSFVTNALRLPLESYAARFPSIELPDIAGVVASILQRVPPAQQPILLAQRERVSAARYRGWAGNADDRARRAALLACADREEEIARLAEALYPDATQVQRDILAGNPDLASLTGSLFSRYPLDQQFILQARAERFGAVTWRAFADDARDPAAREVFLRCALLEEESAAVLESLAAGKRAS